MDSSARPVKGQERQATPGACHILLCVVGDLDEAHFYPITEKHIEALAVHCTDSVPSELELGQEILRAHETLEGVRALQNGRYCVLYETDTYNRGLLRIR